MGKMDDLGEEMLVRIIMHCKLSPLEVCNLSVLSRAWREACASPCLWKQLHLKVPEYNEAILQRVSKCCDQLVELEISKDPMHPRALSLIYSASWLEGVGHVLTISGGSLRRLIVSTGCHIYQKDYRSAPFYLQLMTKVATLCSNLEACEIYYNAGRCGMRNDVPKWIYNLLRGCPAVTRFCFWATAGDCGGLDDKVLTGMVQHWKKLEYLEITGELITWEGVLLLRSLSTLRTLKLCNACLGPSKRSPSITQPEHADTLYPLPEPESHLEEVDLIHTRCDLLDLRILLRQFPHVTAIRILDASDLSLVMEDFESDDGNAQASTYHLQATNLHAQHVQRMSELRSAMLEDPELGRVVSFSGI